MLDKSQIKAFLVDKLNQQKKELTKLDQSDYLEEKKWYLLKANSRGYFEISAGIFKIFNKSFNEILSIELNSGDSFILFTETKIKIAYTNSIEIENLLSNPIPADWLALKIDIQSVLRNRIMVLGASDSGKTTLLKFLAYNLPKYNHKIGLLDLDVGQNSLGLPGTINLATFNFTGAKLIASKFFGHVSTAGNTTLFLQIVKVFFEDIQKLQFDWLFIDTSGYIQTSEALITKNNLLKIINPQVVILIGKDIQKLETKLISRNIMYLPIESAIKGIKREKDPEMRRRKRRERFESYFKDSIETELNIKSIDMITINYERDLRDLTFFEEIMYFLKTNKDKLNYLFIEITDSISGINQYAKIIRINEQTVTILVPISNQIPKRSKIVIGSIILN